MDNKEQENQTSQAVQAQSRDGLSLKSTPPSQFALVVFPFLQAWSQGLGREAEPPAFSRDGRLA